MAEVIAIVIGTCGALMIFQKDIFVIQAEDQSRFVSDTISNNIAQNESGWHNGTFVMNNGNFNGDLDFDGNQLEYDLNTTHSTSNGSDNSKTSSKKLELDMDGRTTLEKNEPFTLVDWNCFVSDMWLNESM